MDMIAVGYDQLAEDYQRIEKAILFLEANYQRQPGLEEVAQSVGLSEYYFQRLFTRWVGISPKRFLQYLTKEGAKQLLQNSESVLAATYEVGLSSPSRLHDLFIACDAVTPGEYKNRGRGLTIVYGFHPSPFGECLLALTERGICYLAFVQEDGYDKVLSDLRSRWQEASLEENPSATLSHVQRVFSFFEKKPAAPLHLFLNGTNFQIKVWEALIQIPPGRVVTYQDIAVSLGMPKAARAVGSAVARNPIPVVIPCHRVIRKEGEFGNYRYGTARKKALLGWEAAVFNQTKVDYGT